MSLDEHTSRQFDAELESVRRRVLQMGDMVEKQFHLAIEALLSGDEDLMERIIDDDHLVNAMEVGIDGSCSEIIARRQPAANDLRMIVMVVKTITDLERIGDEIKKIARAARLFSRRAGLDLPRYNEIRHAAHLTQEMLRKSLDAFASLDLSPITGVLRQDEEVDAEFRAVIRYLISFMIEDPRTISIALEILLVAKAIERIGDHAKNMSEYVVYMVKGRDVRHITLDEVEREILA